jgi:hypothetical protein
VSSDESSLTPAADAGGESPGLTADDRKNLAALEAKLQMVRDMTWSVARRLTTAFYLYGPGGCGKSYAVLEELHRQKVLYRLYNSRMTGRGLFNALEAYPDGIHLLEDMEQLFHDAGARGCCGVPCGVRRGRTCGCRRSGWSRGPRTRPSTSSCSPAASS